MKVGDGEVGLGTGGVGAEGRVEVGLSFTGEARECSERLHRRPQRLERSIQNRARAPQDRTRRRLAVSARS